MVKRNQPSTEVWRRINIVLNEENNFLLIFLRSFREIYFQVDYNFIKMHELVKKWLASKTKKELFLSLNEGVIYYAEKRLQIGLVKRRAINNVYRNPFPCIAISSSGNLTLHSPNNSNS